MTGLSSEQQNRNENLSQSILRKNKQNEKLSKTQIIDRIMMSMGDSLVGVGDSIPSDELHEIGLTLIRSYCSVEMAAVRLKMSPTRLRWLIVNVPELQVYFEIAHQGVKGLTDQRIIEGLEAGDPDIVKMVFSKMYAGRAKGGYNIAELGTVGYNDPLAKKLAEETETDRHAAKTIVEFNFVQKDPKEVFKQIDYIDAEVEDVEEEKGSN
jgi:hypothetical protein